MISWRDEGMILSVRNHGEAAVILDVLTAGHGRHAGVVRGGASHRMRPVLQPGTQVSVDWQARLEEHLGAFRVEPLRARAGAVMGERLALEALNAMAAVLALAVPEREAVPAIYARSIALADRLGGPAPWLGDYARWEVALLGDLGFGLALETCAVTGTRDELVFVSPRTGRAVSRAGAGAWADRLLTLPAFLRDPGSPADIAGLADALRLSGHFLEQQVAGAAGKPGLPAARQRFADLVRRMGSA